MSGVITMKSLGKQGRYGNQIFEYMFLRVYARRYGLVVQVPKWVGCYLYGFNDPPITVELPVAHERRSDRYPVGGMAAQYPPEGREFVNRNFVGYAQFHMSYYRPDKEFIQDLFKPLPVHTDRLQPAVDRLRSLGNTVVGLHVRRGDSGREFYPWTPVGWYLKWLDKYWSTFDRPVLFLAVEDRLLKKDFAQYKPYLVEDLGVTLSRKPYPHYAYLPLDMRRRDPWQMDFFPEVYVLQHCDVIAASVSTFSFCPAMLNPNLQRYFRVSVIERSLVEADVWDTRPLVCERVEDYKHVEGVCLKANPYW